MRRKLIVDFEPNKDIMSHIIKSNIPINDTYDFTDGMEQETNHAYTLIHQVGCIFIDNFGLQLRSGVPSGARIRTFDQRVGWLEFKQLGAIVIANQFQLKAHHMRTQRWPFYD